MTDDALRRLFSAAAGDEPGAPDPGHLIGRARHRIRTRRLAVLGVTVAVAAGVIVPVSLSGSGSANHNDLRLAADLKKFDTCNALLARLQDRTRLSVGAYGYGGAQEVASGSSLLAVPQPQATRAAESAKGSGVSADAPLAHSSTTNRTAGIDEPDLIKTDGSHVFVLQNSTLNIYTATSPKLVGSLKLSVGQDYNQNMLLDGDHVIVIGGQPQIRRSDARHDTSMVTVVDVSDPQHPSVSRSMTVDGSVIDARLQDNQVRLVLQVAPPQLAWFQSSGSAAAQTEATQANRRLLDETTIADWLPTYGLTDGSGNALSHGQLLDCDQVTEPTAAGTTGSDLVGVTTLDPGATKGPAGSIAVIGAGSTVYAAGSHLWLATGNTGGWGQPYCFRCFNLQQPATATTQLHGFDFSDPSHPTYLASAALQGSLHDDSALDETADGTLRVVTTQSDGTRLDILTRDGETMTSVGSLVGLAPNEQVQAVRWIGDLAYVVTLRQIDPLHVIDLSDRAHPRLRGNLTMPGYSSYLFSSERGRLVGTGPGAKSSETVRLFDVNNPDAPTQLSTVDLGGYRQDTSTHAELFWRAARMLFIPVYDNHGGTSMTVTRVDTDSLSAGFRLTHDKRPGAGSAVMQRTAVIGPRIWTVSSRGVLVSTLAAGKDITWMPYGTTP